MSERFHIVASFEVGNDMAREHMLDKLREATRDGSIGSFTGGGYNMPTTRKSLSCISIK